MLNLAIVPVTGTFSIKIIVFTYLIIEPLKLNKYSLIKTE